jgi:hypothetical protein
MAGNKEFVMPSDGEKLEFVMPTDGEVLQTETSPKQSAPSQGAESGLSNFIQAPKTSGLSDYTGKPISTSTSPSASTSSVGGNKITKAEQLLRKQYEAEGKEFDSYKKMSFDEYKSSVKKWNDDIDLTNYDNLKKLFIDNGNNPTLGNRYQEVVDFEKKLSTTSASPSASTSSIGVKGSALPKVVSSEYKDKIKDYLNKTNFTPASEKPLKTATKDIKTIIKEGNRKQFEQGLTNENNILNQQPYPDEITRQKEYQELGEAIVAHNAKEQEKKLELEAKRKQIDNAEGYLRTYPKDLLLASEEERGKEVDALINQYGLSEDEALQSIAKRDNQILDIKAQKTENELWGDIAEKLQKSTGIKPTDTNVDNVYMANARVAALSDMDDNQRLAYPKTLELNKLLAETSQKSDPLKEVKIAELKKEIAQLTNNKTMWFDPVTGKNIGTPTEEAKDFFNKVKKEASSMAESNTKDELENIFRKSYAKYQWAKNLYDEHQQYLTLPMMGNANQLHNSDIESAKRIKDIYIKSKAEFDAISQAYLLNRDISGVERSPLKIAGEAFVKEIIPSSLTPKGLLNNTNEAFIRNIQTLANDNNLKFTKEQEDRVKHTFTEDVAEGVGGVTGMLPKLWLAGEVVGVAESISGLQKALQILSKGDRIDRGISIIGKGIIEEAKMQGVGFDAGVGAGFSMAGGIKTPKLSGKYGAILQPFADKIVKSSVSATAGMELGEITSAAVSALNDRSDFGEKMKEMFPNVSETGKRVLQNLIVNAIIGIPHLSKTDFIFSADKLKEVSNELYSKGYREEAEKVKEKADQIRGYEVDTNAEIDRRIAKGGIVNTEQRPIEKEETPIEKKSSLVKYTSPTNDLYGYVEENGVKRDLTKQEFEDYGKVDMEQQVAATTTEEPQGVGEGTQENEEQIKSRIQQIEGMLSGDNASMQQYGQGNLLREAREQLIQELSDLKKKLPAKATQENKQAPISKEEEKKADYTKRIERKLNNASEEKDPIKKTLILFDALNSAKKVETGQLDIVQSELDNHIKENGLKIEEIPLGTKYDDTNTSLDATISGVGVDNLKVVEVLSPIIRNANGKIVKQGKVVVESETKTKEINQEDIDKINYTLRDNKNNVLVRLPLSSIETGVPKGNIFAEQRKSAAQAHLEGAVSGHDKENTATQASLDKDGNLFIADGRHRVEAQKDSGVEYGWFEVPKDQAKEIESKYETPKSEKAIVPSEERAMEENISEGEQQKAEDVEAKKADIERRRQEAYKTIDVMSDSAFAKLQSKLTGLKSSYALTPAKRLLDEINKLEVAIEKRGKELAVDIDAKYDAELAELESPTTEKTKSQTNNKENEADNIQSNREVYVPPTTEEGIKSERSRIESEEAENGVRTGVEKINDIAVRPDIFQFKAQDEASGVNLAEKLQGDFDVNLAGAIGVWKDEKGELGEKGKVYVVDGHHRMEFAKRSGVKNMNVFYIDAPTAKDARVTGAKANIAQGRGTSIDAAKVYKEATPKQLEGFKPTSRVAKEGMELAKLENSVFNLVVQGKLDIPTAMAIAKVEKPKQESFYKAIKRIEDSGAIKMTPKGLSVMAEKISSGGVAVNKVQEMDLFGTTEQEELLLAEQSQLESDIKDELAKDAKILGSANKNKAVLEKAENVVNEEVNAKLAEQSKLASGLFDTYKNRKEVSDIIKQATIDLNNAKGRKQRAEIKDKATSDVKKAIEAELNKDFNKENTKENEAENANEANRQVVLEGVREAGNESKGRKSSEQLQEEIADLRAKEQAEYDAMSDPNDKVKRDEIYDRYDEQITPLLKEQKALESTEKAQEGKAEQDYQEAISKKSERAKNNAKEKFINDNFDKIVSQLMLENKIKRKC